MQAPDGRDIRPTSDRTRQALFDMLAHAGWGPDGGSLLAGATVLDAFCGTGALALEALSRGAEAAWLIDSRPASLALARTNAELLGEAGRCRFLLADALAPPPAGTAARLAFLDPPYRQDLAARALSALAGRGWLAPGAVAVVESDRRGAVAVPEGFALMDDRAHGDTRIAVLRHGAAGRSVD